MSNLLAGQLRGCVDILSIAIAGSINGMNSPAAIITGAGGGIGRATAIELASRGYRLVLCGRTPETLNQTAAMVGNSLVITADVTLPTDIQRVVDLTLAKFGRIDLIVNNAGIAPMVGIEEITIEQYHAVVDTSLSAAFYLSKAVWPIFRKRGGGVIVNVSSLAARDPFPGFAIYGAAKAGLNLLGLSLAREGATIGVRVYTVAPGAVETGLLRSLFSTEQFAADQAMDPADVAKVIAQCAAADLKFTSGEVIWMHK
jgi:NAD(P)-dependent dehydrogenase (short-subunit alcohol dehydrogenase family)